MKSAGRWSIPKSKAMEKRLYNVVQPLFSSEKTNEIGILGETVLGVTGSQVALASPLCYFSRIIKEGFLSTLLFGF
ncbi:hypothetical protein SAMN05216243_2652 [Sediminibacillus albus]|uniref:Uncharacterized protein n=1 Tax=Sediminibacillus albus TaxID=407036 RepID=A0A1G9APK8_9BACI|nr:hypothetical protein SAMN05216243_2652 [Sediminibacillus albus]